MLHCTVYERTQMNIEVILKEMGQSVMRAHVTTFAG
jgi:hypothetical protein